MFVFLSPGRTGLLPFAETGVDCDAVDLTGRRIRLSRKAVAEERERAELREYAARPDSAPAASLGSMADNLRNALKGR